LATRSLPGGRFLYEGYNPERPYMTELLTHLFTAFVFSPLQAELAEKLSALPSKEKTAAAENCLRTAGPMLLERAQSQWGWVAANVIGINLGLMESTQVLSGLNADCDRVVGLLGEETAEE
jgi:hypothetical protein